MIQKSLDDDQASEIVTIDLRGKTSLADYMLIATGRSARHVTAVAEHLAENLRASGHRHFQIEGLPAADWVLIDAGDIVIHLFKPEAREMYALERMWGPDLDEEQAPPV